MPGLLGVRQRVQYTDPSPLLPFFSPTKSIDYHHKNMGDVDDIAENLRGLVVSNLFEEPPPKEDCPICMLPMPFASGVQGVSTTY